MVIHSWAMVVARGELSHLPEWLDYQHRLGVSVVHLFVEHRFNDGRCVEGKGAISWEKKPEINTMTEVSDEEIMARLVKVSAESKVDVRIYEQDFKSKHVDIRQNHTINRVIRDMREGRTEMADWMLTLDVDEYLVTPGKTLPEYLVEQDDDTGMIRVKQWLFSGRWTDDGRAIMPSEIVETFGMIRVSPKMVFRVKPSLTGASMNTVHCVHARRGTLVDGSWAKPTSNLIRFHHFRGNTNMDDIKGDIAKPLARYRKYANLPFPKKNTGHITQLSAATPKPQSASGVPSGS